MGTPSPAVTRQVAASGTWAVELPRSCFTPSLMRLKPWTYASERPPPPVLRGSRAADLQGAALGERGALAAPAEAVALQGERDERGEGVVDLGDVDVLGAEVGLFPEVSGGGPGGSGERVVVPVVDHAVVLGGQALGGGVHVHRFLAAVARPLGGDDDAGQRPVGLQAVVEEAEGFADPAGGHVHLAGHRALVHDRGGVLVGAVAAGERDVEEVVAGGAVLVHVAAGEHADLVGGAEQPEGAGPLAGVASWAAVLVQGRGPLPRFRERQAMPTLACPAAMAAARWPTVAQEPPPP